MYRTQDFTPLNGMFGNGYVPEQHADEANRYLPTPEPREFVNFDALLKKLRAALSLR
jgi:hypothetical protein